MALNPAPPPTIQAVKPLVLYVGLAGADLGSTEWAISRGAGEMHPWGQTRGRRAAMKAVQVGVWWGADLYLQRHRPGWVRPWRVGWMLATALVTGWNLAHVHSR